MNYDNIDIIVSRYNEDLNWTLEKPFNEFKYIVYNKGDNENFEKANIKQILTLPNVGRCDHTYLYHITENYDMLNNVLVFFPGSLNLGIKKEIAIDLLNRIKNNNGNAAIFVGRLLQNGVYDEFKNFHLENWSSSDHNNIVKNNESILYPANIRPFGKWFLHNFGNIKVYISNYYGIFSVDKKDIIQHRKYRYEKLVKQLEVSSNPEVGHYIERSWAAIFFPLKYSKIKIKNYN
jgi:hypothetical protein